MEFLANSLGELRSFIPQEARLVVVIATATESTRQKIFETLQLGPKTILIEKKTLIVQTSSTV